MSLKLQLYNIIKRPADKKPEKITPENKTNPQKSGAAETNDDYNAIELESEGLIPYY